jgi:hypothetical protein
MRRLRFVLAGTLLLQVGALAPTAEARLVHFPRVHHRGPNIDPFSIARGGGPARRMYPREYDGVRAYYGGRGDDRWRWHPDPGNAPPGLGPTFGWPGGSPWSW